ncbi:MAG TPA: hypothetical protein VN778_05130 [Verrucomicrobiae bacterium]|nr:hypothetical protein [Verrucomicrobiae bacterium]
MLASDNPKKQQRILYFSDNSGINSGNITSPSMTQFSLRLLTSTRISFNVGWNNLPLSKIEAPSKLGIPRIWLRLYKNLMKKRALAEPGLASQQIGFYQLWAHLQLDKS